MSFDSSASTSTAMSIIDYETGNLDDQQVIDFFHELIDNGQAWQLNGSYGRNGIATHRGN